MKAESRAAFERVCVSLLMSIRKDQQAYKSPFTRLAWTFWQAAIDWAKDSRRVPK